jgi:hypothetical protein
MDKYRTMRFLALGVFTAICALTLAISVNAQARQYAYVLSTSNTSVVTGGGVLSSPAHTATNIVVSLAAGYYSVHTDNNRNEADYICDGTFCVFGYWVYIPNTALDMGSGDCVMGVCGGNGLTDLYDTSGPNAFGWSALFFAASITGVLDIPLVKAIAVFIIAIPYAQQAYEMLMRVVKQGTTQDNSNVQDKVSEFANDTGDTDDGVVIAEAGKD